MDIYNNPNLEIKKIIVSRTDNLGDVILTLPLITQIKKTFPEAKITFLVKKYVYDLIKDYPGIYDFAFIDELNTSFALKTYFKQKNFDAMFNVYPRFEIALAAYLSGIKYRIGTGYRWYSYLFNKKIHEHRKTGEKHEAVYNLNLLNSLSEEKKEFTPEFCFTISDEEINKLQNKLPELNLNSDFIIIHLPSKGSAAKLPAKKYIDFTNEFLKEFNNYKVVLTGVEEERNEIDSFMNETESKNNLINLCGRLSLSELKTLISKSNLFLSNSTGPIHIAGALNKNIIGFYPHHLPANKNRWKPLSKNAIILEPETADDMNSIITESIINAAKTLLKK